MSQTLTDIYDKLMTSISSVLQGERNVLTAMSTLSCILKHEIPKNYWVGFYIIDGEVLKVGPYQGTLGCLTIEPDRGVCGRAYRTAETQIVGDVHSDPEHIACDPASRSEIVIPVCRPDGSVYAVLDVDSDRLHAYDRTDQHYLETIVRQFVEPLV